MRRVQSRSKCGIMTQWRIELRIESLILNCHTTYVILPKLVAQWTLCLRTSQIFCCGAVKANIGSQYQDKRIYWLSNNSVIFAHNHLAQGVNAWYRSERNCPPLNLRTSRYLLLIIQHAWLINNMSLVKGMTFKMTQAAKTVEKERFRHRCRAQGIPLHFSRVDQPRSQGLSSPHPKGAREERPWFRLVTCLGDKFIFMGGVPIYQSMVAATVCYLLT